jgi:hypothetical protein
MLFYWVCFLQLNLHVFMLSLIVVNSCKNPVKNHVTCNRTCFLWVL